MMRSVTLEAGRVRARFQRTADRFEHAIEVQSADGRWISIAKSAEGDAYDLWPASPPFQELHVEQRGEMQVALLVGNAGKSHWSGSIEAHVSDEKLVFDVACRAREAPQWLGSTYQMVESNQLSGGFRPRFEAAAEATAVQTDGSRVRVAPIDMADAVKGNSASHAWPKTIRWQYWFAI